MKLQSLTVKNFESWEDQKFDFHPGVNIFVGLSDTGKSAVIRAIRLAVENKPSGERYRSDFADKKAITESTIEFTDGISVSRIRSNSENKYLLTENGKTQTFEAFSTGVPDEIAEAINLTELNIQRQIELPFLLSQNPPDRGRFFNEIAGLDKIDSSQKYANSKVLEEGRECASCEKEIKRIEDELKELEFIPELEQKIQAVSELQKHQDATRIKLQTISAIYSKWRSAKAELEEAEKIDINLIAKKIKSALSLIADYRKQKEHLRIVKNIWEQYCQTNDELISLQTIDFQKLSQKVKTALQYIANYREKRRDLSQIKRSFENYISTKAELRSTEKSLVSESENFKKAIPDICPLCKRKGWKNG